MLTIIGRLLSLAVSSNVSLSQFATPSEVERWALATVAGSMPPKMPLL